MRARIAMEPAEMNGMGKGALARLFRGLGRPPPESGRDALFAFRVGELISTSTCSSRSGLRHDSPGAARLQTTRARADP
ncbi:MAG: hypothetical protein ACR2RL_06810 [Gammaproteobacteria bacterium]